MDIRMVKGSHIVVRRLYEGDHAYILQNEDKRIVFVIPYEGAYAAALTTILLAMLALIALVQYGWLEKRVHYQ